MDVGIGLPTTTPGVDRDSLLDWAREAEGSGFSSLGTIDRLVFDNYEPLISLAAAAVVTERIGLVTDILIAPLRVNAALLAKQAATVDVLSNGRLTLGLGVGGRPDDFQAGSVDYRGRGRKFELMLEDMKAVWSGAERGYAGPIGPRPARTGGPELLIGGDVDSAFQRAARFGEGWTQGGGTPETLAERRAKLLDAWRRAGREGSPRVVALCYFALGEGARDAASGYLERYYSFAGAETAEAIAASAVVDESMARDQRDSFAEAGADELIYFPSSPDVRQVELLANAVL